MYQEERIQMILEYLDKHKRISVEQICSLCNVSRDTARRDLVKLEERGAILRTRGGALLPTLTKEIESYKDRLQNYSQEKRAIGKLAASLIRNGDKIIMDTSTTVQACSEFLQVDDCTIITNSINQADILSNKPELRIHLLGGQLNQEQRFLYGQSVISMLSNYYVDKAFIGTCGLTEQGVMVAFEEDGFIMKRMIEQAEQVILLIDSSKFGKKGFFKVADLSQIDIIITDKLPDESLMTAINNYEINIMLAK
ncbi:DeoR/GlpR family DNA-binding transcription regulator [Wukongibacter sp. M2B1]|uniref:DeoR/GlpR family DNA-binding transcription regulator n=1 Tax=Wukongibacter sp. M2B1 TaxID=3088895 RepID=UPI003D78FF12